MIGLGARLWLGVILLAASLDKVFEPVAFAQAVSNYRLLADWAVPLVALIVPWLELVVGCSLVVGLLTDSAALLAGGLAVLFAGVLGSALARGLNIECGCFNDSARVSWSGLALDFLLLGLAGVVLRWGPGRWALDGLFAPAQEPAADH